MIDTVALTLNKGMYWIKDPDMFEPSARYILDDTSSMGGRGYTPAKQNPTKRELQSGIYKPRLTLTNRFNHTGKREATLKVELSLPKLLFGNNFDELIDSDFEGVIQKLQIILKEMGVYPYKDSLITAPVSLVHFPKNIPLTDGSTPSLYIKEIQKANITQRLDFNQTDFRNEGQSFKFRANNYEVVFYDKLREFLKAKISEKRTEEKDYAIQFGLFEKVSIKKPFELLRMEVRLNQRQKIKQVFGKIGLNIEPTFQNLFNTEIAKRVLLYHLDLIESSYPKLLYFKPKSNKDFIAQFVIDNPKAKLKDSLLALGFYLALEDIGTREIRELLKRYPASSWYSFIKRMNGFTYTKNRPSPFELIRNAINEFKPISLVDFRHKMLNNDKYNQYD